MSRCERGSFFSQLPAVFDRGDRLLIFEAICRIFVRLPAGAEIFINRDRVVPGIRHCRR
jgi:hypothetical protein